MKMPLSVLFLAVALVAAGLGLFRGAWESGETNHDLLMGVYLILLTAAVVAATRKDARFRPGLIGASVFGLGFLVCSMQGGFFLDNIYDSQALAKNTKIGIAQLGIAFLTTQFFAAVLWPTGTLDAPNSTSPLNATRPSDSPPSDSIN